MAQDLTDLDLAILAFERQRWNHAGAKETAIRDTFGLTATAYYQRVNALLDRPEAYVADPPLVKRLQRLRQERAARAGRRR